MGSPRTGLGSILIPFTENLLQSKANPCTSGNSASIIIVHRPGAWKLSLDRLGWERCPGTKALGRLGAGVVRQGWKSEVGKGFLDGKVLGRLGWEGCPGTKVLGRLGWQAGWGEVCIEDWWY